MAELVSARCVQPGAAGDEAVLRLYGFAVPTDAALDEIARRSPAGVVELGAGVDYWAHHLFRRGVDVVAYDIEPPPSALNHGFAGSTPWHPIARGNEFVVAAHPDRSLLLIWPTKNETWAARALLTYAEADGALRALRRRRARRPHGGPDVPRHPRPARAVPDTPCTCDARQLWRRVGEVGLPSWQAEQVSLSVYERFTEEPTSIRRHLARHRRRVSG